MRAVRADDGSSPRASGGQPLEAPRLREAAGPAPEDGPPLVLVEWHDAWFDPDQQTPDDWRSDYLVRTVGFLVRKGPRVVSVAQELLPEEDGYRAVTHIPASMIERITHLHLQAKQVPVPDGEAALGA